MYNLNLDDLTLFELAQLLKLLWFSVSSFSFDLRPIVRAMLYNAGENDTIAELIKIGFLESTALSLTYMDDEE